jgi:hypothetical protein
MFPLACQLMLIFGSRMAEERMEAFHMDGAAAAPRGARLFTGLSFSLANVKGSVAWRTPPDAPAPQLRRRAPMPKAHEETTTSRHAMHPAIALALILAGCASPAAGPDARLTLSMAEGERAVLGVIQPPDGGEAAIRADAPWAALGPDVEKLPPGKTLRIDCFPRDLARQALPQAQAIYYAEGQPFELAIVAGARLAVLDGDASDGQASVAVPQALYRLYLGTSGKPGGSLQVADPIYFQRGAQGSTTGKPAWTPVGTRAIPLDPGFRRGAYRLRLTGSGLTTFSAFLAAPESGVTAAPLPPIAPVVSALSGPDSLFVDQIGTLTASAQDRNGDALGYRWSTTTPAGALLADYPAAGATTAWQAAAPGRYLVGLTVEDAYFRVTCPQPLAIEVQAALSASASASGGGHVMVTPTTRREFNFHARLNADGTVDGRVQVAAANARANQYVGAVQALSVAGRVATMRGVLADGLTPFSAVATDNGEGAAATSDRFSFSVDANRNGRVDAGEQILNHAIAGGNVQVR